MRYSGGSVRLYEIYHGQRRLLNIQTTMETLAPEPGPSTADADDNHVLHDEETFIMNVSQFFNQEALSDVLLKVSDKQYFGHKFVLAKSSEVFRTMLYDNKWTQVGETDLILTESPECQAVFDVFLKFLYTAEIAITVDTAVGVLCLADKYNVSSLKALCVGWMVQNTKSPKVPNALNWYSWAKALNLEELVESCTKTIAWNIETILGSDDWHRMDSQFICDILNNSGLVVANEYVLYNGLVDWLVFESHREELQSNSLTLLPLIRFPQMMVNQLYDIERSELSQMAESKDVIKDLISKAYRFRSLCPSQAQLAISFDEAFYKPRNYLDLAVDTVRMQNTLRFGIQVDVRSCVGPVPSDSRTGDWKLTYRKSADSWSIQIFCHESATINGEAYIEASVLVFNEEDQVIQVDLIPPFSCARARNLSLNVNIENPAVSKNMVVLIKPIPH